jgi:hypothetical protein
MKAIKHLINIAFLWTLPYTCLLFFWLLTLCQFDYKWVVMQPLWIIIVGFYSVLAVVLYSMNNGSEDDIKIV